MLGINFDSGFRGECARPQSRVVHRRRSRRERRWNNEGCRWRCALRIQKRHSHGWIIRGRASARLLLRKGSLLLLPLAACCLEPDESAPQTSVKHRRFQQDNELFCSGERFHSVSPVLTGEGSGQKNRERERGTETQPSLPFPFHYHPRRPVLHTAVKFSHRCVVGGRRGGVVVSRGSFISARRPQNPMVRSLSRVPVCPTSRVIWREISGTTRSGLYEPRGGTTTPYV